MGLLGKLKNIFYDEEIIEEEEKKEEVKPKIQEVNIPKREEMVKPRFEEAKPSAPVYTERELFKSESTFKFPFEEEDDVKEPAKLKTRMNILEVEKRKPEVKEQKKEPVSINKTFKPSPVISPVYGVLDKNYSKEEIIESTRSYEEKPQSELSYDSIRRKAYGTLEDELENTLTKINKEVVKIHEQSSEFKKEDESIEDLINQIENKRNLTVGEIEDKYEDTLDLEKEIVDTLDLNKTFKRSNDEFTKETTIDKTLEHDLFNLIDSMYEDKEGE